MLFKTGRNGGVFFTCDSQSSRITRTRILTRAEAAEGPLRSSEGALHSLSTSLNERTTLDEITSQTIDSEELRNNVELQKRLWKKGIKLPFCLVGILPVLVGSSVSYYQSGVVQSSKICELVLAACSVIFWLNLSNDVFDHETGVDVTKPESLVNLTQNKSLIYRLSLVFLFIAFLFIGHVIYQSSTLLPLWMLSTSILCGYVYQGPPFRLSYKGLGEPLCFLAFGPLATTAFYMLTSNAQSLSTVPIECWAASILVGLTTTIILFCSHFHQFESDLAAKKYSPVVQLGGPDNALKVLFLSLASICGLSLSFVWMGWLPKMLLMMSVLPFGMAVRCGLFALQNLSVPSRLPLLKLTAIGFHSSFGMTLILVFILTKKFSF